MPQNPDPCVFLLAGGRGRRLQPYTTVLPKPLIPICDVPISEVLLHQLRQAGFRRVIMAVNHHEALLRSYFGDGSSFGIDITYSREDQSLGTVGPLHLVADRLPQDFLVLNSDLLTDLDFRAFFEKHLTRPSPLTIATHRRTLHVGDGVIDTDPAGRVNGFREKPQFDFWVSAGIYAMRRSILEFIPPSRPFGMDELVHVLLRADVPIQTHRHQGEWYDIGSHQDLERATTAFSERRTRFLPTPSPDQVEVT